jgi:arginine-tRNA-protein transferase
VEYRLPNPDDGAMDLIGACLTDVLGDGLSMVYSFFEPTMRARSFGAYMILDHVEIARAAGLPYVYLGYWVPGSPKMAYKSLYRPFEVHQNDVWRPVNHPDEVEADAASHSPDPIAEQVARLIDG